MTFPEFVSDFMIRKYPTMHEINNKVLAMDLRLVVEKDGVRTDVSQLFAECAHCREEFSDVFLGHAKEHGGKLQAVYSEQIMSTLIYDETGNCDVTLEFMAGKAKDFKAQFGMFITNLRQAMVDSFEDEDFQDLIEVTGDFLSLRAGETFEYTLYAEEKPFLRGSLQDRDLRIQLLEPLVYLKMLLFVLEGGDFLKFKLRNPLDIMRLMERMQEGIRMMSTVYADAGVQISIGVFEQDVFCMGRDVKPNITGMFGPTNIRLDSMFRLFSSLFSKIPF